MAQMNINYITNPQVNSGETINLLGSRIKFGWDLFSKAPDTPSKSVTDTLNDRLGKGIYTGFKNPKISINGQYYLNITHITGSSAIIDFEHILDLGKRGDQICTLKSDIFITTDNPTGEINVMLENISLTNDNDNIVTYTLNCYQTRSDS